MRRFTSTLPALLVLLVAALTLWAGPSFIQGLQLAERGEAMQAARAKLESGDLANQLDLLQQAGRAVHDAVMPGVAHIDVRSRLSDEQEAALRERLGGRALPPGHPGIPSTGSGWVYDALGHIITNAHVVRDAESVRVELNDGRVFDAKVLGADEATDVAVLFIDPRQQGNGPLFPLVRAASQPVMVGDRAFVFGSPFGFKFSMSHGVVSALGRSEAASWVGMLGGYTNYIQTDAAMNPGNSGGPVVNIRGQVIGMSIAIANARTDSSFGPESANQQGQNAGLGFAIPVDTVETVVEQLISSNVVIRGFLGIRLGELSPSAAERFGFVGRGVLVGGRDEVDPQSPAGKAGIKRGDIIVAFNDRPTPDGDILRSNISIRKPGEIVRVTVWRDGKMETLEAKLGAAYTRRAGPGVFVPVQVPGGEDMTMDQIREWVKDQSTRAPAEEDGPPPEP
ncbi:MAG: S1C family serine protease [Phycisphaerales bacterium]